jgi:hypothetical protein
MLEGEDGRKRFELPGSRAHYAPSLLFTISHMQLAIEPDLHERTISCSQRRRTANKVGVCRRQA